MLPENGRNANLPPNALARKEDLERDAYHILLNVGVIICKTILRRHNIQAPFVSIK